MLKSTDCGFHITFGNGYTVSVQWGPDNYCENRGVWGWEALDYTERRLSAGRKGSKTVEVAVWDRDGNFVKTSKWAGAMANDEDDVVGHMTADQLVHVFYRVSLFYRV